MVKNGQAGNWSKVAPTADNTNEDAVSKTVEAAGFDPYEKKLLGITTMQKLLGKSRFEELLAAYIEKP